MNNNNNKENQEFTREEEELLALSLSLDPKTPKPTATITTTTITQHHHHPLSETTPFFATQRPPRARRNVTELLREGKIETVHALYPWATNHRATIHNLDHLVSMGIMTITGAVRCKKCEKAYELQFDLKTKFMEVGGFVIKNKESMRDRAPRVWMNPTLPTCRFCHANGSVKPVIAEKKKEINWLFLLLGQMLGCCSLEQLKYFCKHTKNHRTGAKDRVLFLTYLGLCKQLDPNGPFDR